MKSLRTASISVTPINRYRSSSNPPVQPLQTKTLHYSAQSTLQPSSNVCKQNRKRGVVLSQQGWQKLVQADALHDQFGKRYTHEQLSERTLLDVRTISRILNCEVKVDKSTLRTFFRAFDLQLEVNDYKTPVEGTDEQNQDRTRVSRPDPQSIDSPAALASIAPELRPLVEELLQFRQRMLEDYEHFLSQLGLNWITGRLQN